MITYQQYEKAVFDWLMAKRDIDKNFTFSTRVRSSAGAERDYFIGTEKSNYFGFTLWDISVSYPGSSMDLIDFFFEDVDKNFKFVIECRQTNNPEGKQNESALKLIRMIREQLGNIGTVIYESKENGKDFNFKIGSPKAEYNSISEMLNDLDLIMGDFIPVVQKCIEEVKKGNPEFKANRISIEDFENHFLKKTLARIEKENSIPEKNDENRFKEFVAEFNEDNLSKYIQFIRGAIGNFNLSKGDERLVFNAHYKEKYLSFNVGQRYCLTLHQKNSKGSFGFITSQKIDDSSEQFDGKNPEAWYTHSQNLNVSNELKFSIYYAIEVELKRSTKSGYRKNNILEFENLIFNGYSIKMNNSNVPLNQILYGPPGTGKTFNTIDTAISIINPQFDLKKERKGILEEYHRLVKAGNIVFTTFHQSMSYEDFIEGIKPLKSDSGDSVIYDVEAGLFKIACANAGYFCYQKSLENDKKQHKYTFDDLYDSFIEYYQEFLEAGTEFSFKTLTGKEVTIIHINSNDSIQARALHSTATKKPAPLTKENLQKLYDRFSSVEEISTLSQVQETVEVTPRTTEFYAVFKGLKEYEKTIFKPEEIESIAQIEVLDEKDKLKKFDAGVFKEAIKANSQNAEKVVMIIDEINRGNISAIFGELITLIEESKRLGKDEFLEITLPYSKKKFSVPANLYIIGTMNTADRSVEALDTALRRRFSFVEKLPDPERLKDKGEDKNGNVGSINLPELLSVINDRIEVLVDRDHTIGHAFFMDVKSIVDLKHVFADKIIPLLQEYFYGNYAKMEMVSGPYFFDEKNGNKPIQFAVQNDNIEVSETNYKLKNIHDDSFDLEKALKRLLNTSDSEVEKSN